MRFPMPRCRSFESTRTALWNSRPTTKDFTPRPTSRLRTYRVVVEKAGFSRVTREPVDVLPRAEATVNFTLQPGAVTDSVTVTSEAPILDTAAVNNSVGFNDNLVEQLPLIVVGTKRDVTGFLDNMPGANNTNTFTLTLNGSTVEATEAFVDGARASERIEKGSLSENGPFLEQVGEVTVVSGAFNAEYGGFGNWFTNVVIKSGTNKLHGSVFDHLGNDKLNARSFFAQARTPYRQNEGGFTLGGPVVIPHIYNGRNKTFFFGSLGLFYSRQGAAGLLATVPTQAMREWKLQRSTDGGRRRCHSHLRPELHAAGRQWKLRAFAVPRKYHSRQPDQSDGEDRRLLHPGAEPAGRTE